MFLFSLIGIISDQTFHFTGYFRILSAILAFYYGFYDQYILYFLFYSVSQLLDAVDGHAARFFNQCL